MTCIFCDILAGRSPSSLVFRDALCCAFMDIQPVNPGHVLIVPTCHAASLTELDETTGAHMFNVAQRVAQALRDSGLECEGVNLFLADGAAAGQEVFHVHLHVLPRYSDDGFGFTFRPGYGSLPARAELNATAGRIRRALGS